VVLLDVTPLSLGIETFGGLMNLIIPRNSTIPCKAGEMFTNAMPGQRSMLIRVLQGERELAMDNWELGQFELEFQPAAKGQARVGVQFELDTNGILHVLARDTQTGQEQRVEMKSAVNVTDEAVEKMLDESLEHAFEDMNARQFAEAKLKADDLLAAVQMALTKLGTDISEGDRVEVETLVRDVESAVVLKSVPALKKANEALDHGTEHLAALLIDQAMR
jgi:molecular chaperone DnaK